MFQKIEDDEAVIVENGVYRTAEVYEYNGGLYLRAKGGFVRLKADGSTSASRVRLECLHRDGPLFRDRFGRIRVSPNEGSKAISLGDDGALLIEDKSK